MHVQFRDASADDAPLLGTMNHRLIRDEGHRNPMTVDELAARMRDWLHAGEYAAVLFTVREPSSQTATAIEQAVGYALFRAEPDYIYLRQLFVDAEHRRHGIGRRALDWLAAERWAGQRRVRVEVLSGNAVGIAFWHGCGFADYCLTLERELGTRAP